MSEIPADKVDEKEVVVDLNKGKLDEEKHLVDIVSGEEYIDTNKVEFLDFERQMFLEILHSDGLVICGKGISYDRVLINILRVYSDAGNLILIVNASEWEENYYKRKLEKKYVHEISTSGTERERVYLEGGIQFVSTRILVVDFLKKRVPIELITGIVVLRAHNIVESCQEAFTIRLYRQINKTGFIKAFSNSPESFTIGYSHVERTMRNLFVKDLFIWPRFHASVQSTLKPFEAPTVELHVPMTQKMIQIQTNILDIMNCLVKELKRINPTVDTQEITVENCVTKKFHKILQAQLETIWHQLNSHTKLIISDLKILRNLMISTMYNDCISAYALVKRYRTTEYALSNSGWTLLDAAENIFTLAKNRVFNENDEFEPEHCPKWKILLEILRVEIPNDIKKLKLEFPETVKILILCQDTRTCYQLNQYLTQGGNRYLLYTALKNDMSINKLSESFKNVQYKSQQMKNEPDTTQKVKSQTQRQSNKITVTPSNEKGKCQELEESQALFEQEDNSEHAAPYEENDISQILRNDETEGGMFRESYFLTMTQKSQNHSLYQQDDLVDTSFMEEGEFEAFPEMENLDLSNIAARQKQPIICIQTFKTETEGSMALERLLEEIKPQYVVMYHCNVTAIRQLELFEARQKRSLSKRLRVFFLIHVGTVEEQSYLTSLLREKKAFELLIDTKKKMVVPEYQDGKTNEAFILMKDHTDHIAHQNTRDAGGQKNSEITPKIVVDMREFRSDLPCLLHKRGIEVVPVTITIGDYIITPEICVERKSISDLIGSLNSGRLYNQCIQMQRYYSKPILLIEFDQNKPFYLQGKYMLSGDSKSMTNTDIVQKLQLLTLYFPKLRLIWSPNPYATAELFDELKQDKPEPDASVAAEIGSAEAGPSEIDKFNPSIYDFMIRLPGITSKNIAKVMRHGGSLKTLLEKTEAELADLLQSEENGKIFFSSLHMPTQTSNKSAALEKPFPFGFRRGKFKKF